MLSRRPNVRPTLTRQHGKSADVEFDQQPLWILPSRRLRIRCLTHNARTLDDLVEDMLRPMLKSWLDDNLPSLVERLVRAEIERVSRGR